jgi:hypothetical protein
VWIAAACERGDSRTAGLRAGHGSVDELHFDVGVLDVFRETMLLLDRRISSGPLLAKGHWPWFTLDREKWINWTFNVLCTTSPGPCSAVADREGLAGWMKSGRAAASSLPTRWKRHHHRHGAQLSSVASAMDIGLLYIDLALGNAKHMYGMHEPRQRNWIYFFLSP